METKEAIPRGIGISLCRRLWDAAAGVALDCGPWPAECRTARSIAGFRATMQLDNPTEYSIQCSFVPQKRLAIEVDAERGWPWGYC